MWRCDEEYTKMEQVRMRTSPIPPSVVQEEEILVPDARGALRPAQMVEHKLATMLETCPVLVSHLQDSIKRRPR
jgi:hypothetical protein